jgi:PAS domain S-box-containing protein
MNMKSKSSSPDARNWPVGVRLALFIGLTVLYVPALILLQPVLGGSVSALALSPVAIAGWLFGLRGGLLASVLLLASTIFLLNLTAETGASRALLSGLPGFTALVLGGLVVGWLSDLRELLRKELADRRGAEEALRGERDFAESLIETAQAVVLMLDTEGRIVRFNPYMEEISGYRLVEVQGKDWFATFLPERERERIEGIFADALNDIQTRGNVNSIVAKDGHELLTEWYDKTLKDADGNVIGLLAVGQDVTERKRAEEALQNSEKKYRSLFERVPVGLYRVTPGGQIIDVNPALVQMLGYPNREALLAVNVVTDGYVDSNERQEWQALAERENSISGYETQWRRQDGSPVWIRESAYVVRDEAGRVLYYEGSVEDITKSKQAEAEVAGLAKFPGENPAPVLRVDNDGTVIYANDSATLLLDAWESAVGQPLPKYWHRFVTNALDSAESQEAEFECDGLTYSLLFTPIPDAGYVNVYGLDISGRVQMEEIRAQAEAEREEVLATEREQRLLAETLTDVTLALTSRLGRGAVLNEILDQVQRVVPYSTANIALLEDDGLHIVRWRGFEGFDDDKFRAGPDWSLTDLPLDGEAVHSRQPMVIPDVRQERRWKQLEGTEWMQSYLSMPICLGDRVLGLLRLNGATAHQFSDRDIQRLQPLASAAAVAIQNTRLVESLEEEVSIAIADIIAEKQKSEIILRSVDDAIALSDLDGHIQYVNDAYATLTGYAPEEVWGNHVDFLAAEAVSEHVQQTRQAAVEHGEIWRGEAALRRKDGRTYDAELSFAPVYDARGLLAGLVSSHRDISRRKDLERARNQFITNVSHQLRTPVTTIQMYAHLLQKEDMSEKAKESFQVIKGEAVRLIGLIEDILAMATFDSGQIIDTWRPVSVPLVVSSILSLYREQAQKSGLVLETTALSPDEPVVDGDQARLAQALGEVVENAIIFTPAGGRVSVDVEDVEDQGRAWVKIAVRDTGPGIPTEERERVFDRFFRGSIVETGNIPGTGLGLSIAQEIVHAHGGRVEVKSKVGGGSTVTMWLPMGGGGE